MSDYARLKALATEAHRRGDRDVASRAMQKMKELKAAYDAAGVDMGLLDGPKAMSDTEARQQWIKENPWKARGEAFSAGAGDLGRNLANMVLPDSVASSLGVGDEDIRRKRAENAELEAAHGGFYTAGQIVPTFITAGTGGGGGVLAKAIAANPIKMAMLQGGVLGAATAGPDDRWEGAALGAATAGAVGKALQVGGRAISSGLAPMTDKAKDYVDDLTKLDPKADRFLPVHAAGAKEGLGSRISSLYGKYLRQASIVDDALLEQERNITGNALKATTRAAYGQNADDVLNQAMPGGKVSELGGANNFRAAMPVGDALYKQQFDDVALPPLRQALAASKANVEQVAQSVQPGLQKTMAQLSKAQQKVADIDARLKALGPAMQQADEAAEAAQPTYLLAKTRAKEAREALRAAEEVLAKRSAEAQSAAARSGTTQLSSKQAEVAASRLARAQKEVEKALTLQKDAAKALRDAGKVAKPAAAKSMQLIQEEAALEAAKKSAERGLKAASTRMGNVQSQADAAIAAAEAAKAQSRNAVVKARMNSGVPATAKSVRDALAEASQTPTGNPTMLGLAKAARAQSTPQADLVENVALGADALTKDAAWKTTSGSRGMAIAMGLAGPVLRPLLAGRGFQSFLLGNTAWQNAINRAYSSGGGVAVRRAVSQALRAYLATGAGDVTADTAAEIREALNKFEEQR